MTKVLTIVETLERLTWMKTLSNGNVVFYIRLFGILNLLRSSWSFPYAFRFPSLKIWRFLDICATLIQP